MNTFTTRILILFCTIALTACQNMPANQAGTQVANTATIEHSNVTGQTTVTSSRMITAKSSISSLNNQKSTTTTTTTATTETPSKPRPTGTVTGNISGNADLSDRAKMNIAFENNVIGQPASWTNDKTGTAFALTATKNITYKGNEFCREYTMTTTNGGSTATQQGIACRLRNGSWKAVS